MLKSCGGHLGVGGVGPNTGNKEAHDRAGWPAIAATRQARPKRTANKFARAIKEQPGAFIKVDLVAAGTSRGLAGGGQAALFNSCLVRKHAPPDINFYEIYSIRLAEHEKPKPDRQEAQARSTIYDAFRIG